MTNPDWISRQLKIVEKDIVVLKSHAKKRFGAWFPGAWDDEHRSKLDVLKGQARAYRKMLNATDGVKR